MSAAELIGTGIIMGTLHVLTGPDHLSALATLSSTDLSSRAKRNEEQQIKPANFDSRAFLLGVRWGIGHSIGLLVVGGILICIQEGTTSGEWIGLNNWVTNLAETFVGVFMIGLGSYGAMKALTNREYIHRNKAASSAPSSRSRKLRRNSRSMGTCSSQSSDAGTMPVDNKSSIKNRVTVKNNLVVTGGIDLPQQQHRGRTSIIERMPSASSTRDTQIKSQWDKDNKKHVSDADRRLWNAAKSFTDNFTMYASDDESCGKSRSDSVVTIPMSTLMMDDLQKMYDNANDSLDDDDDHMNRLFDGFDDTDGDSIPRDSCHDFEIPTAFGGTETKTGSIDDIVSEQRRRHKHKCFVCTPSVLALFTGLVHGVAGPGGVLGIIPAVEMQNVVLAMAYLSTFCITSTLVMGSFAAFYGRMCFWLADDDEKDANNRKNRVFMVEFGSACLSIIVGIVWLTLLAVGELNEVFP